MFLNTTGRFVHIRYNKAIPVTLKWNCRIRLIHQKDFWSCEADGKVFLAAINFPGSWVDGALTTWILGLIRSQISLSKTALI